jgi:hypothetical protein
LASVRSCLERATRKHGERIVDCQDIGVNELRAFLREKAQVARARLDQIRERTYPMDERWFGTLEGATEALKNLDEATGDRRSYCKGDGAIVAVS